MKLSLSFKLATVASMGISIIAPQSSVQATDFGEFAVDQSQFVAVAVPFNYKQYKLAIIEQVPGQKSCWQESGHNPTTVDLSLLNFDHTNACRKAVDTNGYSLRHNGKDDKVEYTLNLRVNNGELQLIADHQDPRQSDLIIGNTNGLQEAPMKIQLSPEWQFTKRLYQGSAIQHIYVSDNPNPQVMKDISTLAVTNDPAHPSSQSTGQNIPQEQPVATQTQPLPQTPATTVGGLVDNILTPLSQALYNTYNSLFAPTNNPPQSQPSNPPQSQPSNK